MNNDYQACRLRLSYPAACKRHSDICGGGFLPCAVMQGCS
jgi:hypothetical protein